MDMMKVDKGVFDVSMNTTSETGMKTGLHLKFSYRAKPLFLYSRRYANTPGS